MELYKKLLKEYMRFMWVNEGPSYMYQSDFKALSDGEYTLLKELHEEMIEEQKSLIEGGV